MGYQIKITIRGSKPPIWRRVIVPDRITFADLDAVIESVFGWTHSHLYEFYFKNEDAIFTIDPDDYGQEDAEKECIDAWMWEGNRCEYTYDFGDDWKHDLVVEKIVPYEYRYAAVVKSKGPYMLEDCGGLWRFYEYIEEAEEFELEYANQVLRGMEFDEAEPRDADEEFEEFLKSVEGREMLLDEMDLMMDELYERKVIAENWIEQNKDAGEIPTLESVLIQYPKKVLTMIAKVNAFSGYTSLKKAELAKWIAKRLLDDEYMRGILEVVSREEVEIFEKAMNHPAGIWMNEEVIGKSLFLCAYGAFNMVGVLRIPKDVREKYQNIFTIQYRRDKERKWLIADYCECAGYLYGVIPIDKMAGIYLEYEKDELTIEEVIDLIDDVVAAGTAMCRKGDLLFHKDLEEEEMYRWLLEMQGEVPYYVPEKKEEFLSYMMEYVRGYDNDLDEPAKEFVKFVQTEYQLEEPFSKMIYSELKTWAHMGYDLDMLMAAFEEGLRQFGESVSRRKQVKTIEKKMRKLLNHTRTVVCRGYTRAELCNRDRKTGFSIVGKTYPNDPCPCGSGMKYKHCCGKKK
ncbi:IS1096 element passenger TnpR family protein [Bariatricus sp. SGI.154]|uniref:IS1096 element passenger TnpR family protein n=1 Tax=Bariatricus sp. SGI.154 TaxID=3420549 RepID=UPI003D049298